MAGFGIIFAFLMLIFFGLLFFIIVANWKVYKKMGLEGWECIVPIYNLWVLAKAVGKPPYWGLLCCIPYIGIIWAIWLCNMLSKSFGKEEGFTVGMVILPFIFIPILGFGDAKYLGPYGDPVAFRAYNENKKFDFENNNLIN